VGVGQGQRFGRRPIGHSAGLELIRCCCCHKGSEKKGQAEREKVASELNHLAIKPCLEQRIENKGIEKT
jgi:hypothetical protein